MPQGNAQKTPIQRSLNVVAERRAAEAIALLGKALPCSVSAIPFAGLPVVTVKFEVQTGLTLPKVTVPVAGFEYMRYPIQVGCKGLVFPADAYLGGMTGLGGGTADLSTPANLSALVFFPLGNKGWAPSEDPNSTVIYGPGGVILRDANGACRLTLTPGGVRIDGPFHVTGPVTFDVDLTVLGTIHGVAAVLSGAVSAASVAVVGALTAASATLTGVLAAASGAFSGVLSAASAALTGLMSSGSVAAATSVTAGTNITAVAGTVSGLHVQANDGILTNPVNLGTHHHGYVPGTAGTANTSTPNP